VEECRVSYSSTSGRISDFFRVPGVPPDLPKEICTCIQGSFGLQNSVAAYS